jgi:hypothetical protein
MWELLAPIVRWPLYSPTRFVTVVLVTLVGVFLVGQINGDHDEATGRAGPEHPASRDFGEPPTSATSPATTVPYPSPASVGALSRDDQGTNTDALSVDPAADDPSAAAADAAAAFVAAWARPDLDAKAWAAGVRPLATDELWTSGLSQTDPSRAPQVTVRGEPRQVAMNAEEGVFDVPTTGAWVRVHVSLAAGDDAWLVSSVEPAD